MYFFFCLCSKGQESTWKFRSRITREFDSDVGIEIAIVRFKLKTMKIIPFADLRARARAHRTFLCVLSCFSLTLHRTTDRNHGRREGGDSSHFSSPKMDSAERIGWRFELNRALVENKRAIVTYGVTYEPRDGPRISRASFPGFLVIPWIFFFFHPFAATI